MTGTPRMAAEEYVRRGWAPIPVPRGKKAPVRKGWQQLRLSADMIGQHFNGHTQNIGVLLGEPSGWLVDIDLDHALAVKFAADFLPPTPAIFGRKSKPRSHWLFRVTDPIETEKFSSEKSGMLLEIRASGCQTIFPPSEHPSGEQIVWVHEGNPCEVDGQTLRECARRLAEKIRLELGEMPNEKKQNSQMRTTPPDPTHDRQHIIERCRRYVATMPPSIAGQGGHDAAFSVACVLFRFALSMSEARIVFDEFNLRCDPPWSDAEIEHKLNDAQKTVEADGTFGSLLDDRSQRNDDVDLSRIVGGNGKPKLGSTEKTKADPDDDDDLDDEPDDRPAKPGPFPLELIEKAPDIVRRAFEFYAETAIEVQPVLFLASFIAATGTILGHKVQDKSGLRTNVYTLGILPSGGGKEATREFVWRIFQHAGIPAMCGEEDFASDSGLIAAVEKQNPILFQLDEFGRFMHCINQGSSRSPHYYNIASVLLKFYGKANSIFRSKAYADTSRNKVIVQPHVSIYGTSVRSNFWRSMDRDSLDGGFLPRTLLFEAGEDSTPGGENAIDPPDEVVDFFRFWANRKVSSGNLECTNPQPMTVPFSQQAVDVLAELRKAQKLMIPKFDGLGVLWSRARENAGKLALMHACWSHRDEPIVDLESAQWAIDVVTHCLNHVMFEAYLCVSENPFHERCQRIMQIVERSPGRRISLRDFNRATRSMIPKEKVEALGALIEQKRLKHFEEAPKGRKAHFWGVP